MVGTGRRLSTGKRYFLHESDTYPVFVAGYDGKVGTIKSKSVGTFVRNRWSRSAGMAGHVRP
jgi:hypothetical protein